MGTSTIASGDSYISDTSGTVTSVSGTANRITVTTGTTTPVIDIAATYIGQTSITTLGTIGTGTWNGTLIGAAKGGTGVANNAASTITISGNFGSTFTVTGTTSVTFPTSGTLTTLATVLATANTWGAVQTFPNSDIKLVGSSTGATTFTSANAGASNYTLTFPAITDTLTTNTSSAIAFTGGSINGVTLGAVTPMQIQGHRPQVTISATTRTLALTDADTFQITTNGSATTITVDTNGNVAFATNTEIDFFQQGAGQVTFAAAGGVTIQSKSGNLKLTGQYSGATLKKLASDTWALVGDLTA